MELLAFSIKDRALAAYMRPWFAVTTGQAIRMFTDELNRHDSEMFKHQDDYDLYHLGSFDEETGKMKPIDTPMQIAIGKHLKLKT